MVITVRLHRVVAATPGQFGDAVGRSHTHLVPHSAARSNGAYWGAELPPAIFPNLQFLGAPGPLTRIVRLGDRSDAAPGSGYAH